MKRSDIESRQIDEKMIELQSSHWHREGSDDYTNDITNIVEIVDSAERCHQPLWYRKWTELAPGIETRASDGINRLRIQAGACPVLVRFAQTYEYVSYSDREHNVNRSHEYWVRYDRKSQ
jgi:hypothetical protein